MTQARGESREAPKAERVRERRLQDKERGGVREERLPNQDGGQNPRENNLAIQHLLCQENLTANI